MVTLSDISTLCCFIGATLMITGCDKAEPVTYQIPKESREVAMPGSAAQAPAATSAPSGMNVMPGMQQAADSAGGVNYKVPEGWTELPASGLRKANLRVSDDNGSAELTVTIFPGDVGGNLANINRWRGQVGLGAITPEELATCTESYTISQHGGLYTRIEGGSDSILGALLPFHGNTWFFKLQGNNATALAAEPAFKAFLDSVALQDTHH
ncbi:MAG: hypothetical protein NWS71_05820 [Opitutales bacterium]|jgi:hypothetical protein|nr:hypothetical protein [Opitutales bacterium]MDP4878384.1 hypothetical protein [Opitutales bacterium]MDP4883121.1 hypothetical protein [Opitutales bacterium]